MVFIYKGAKHQTDRLKNIDACSSSVLEWLWYHICGVHVAILVSICSAAPIKIVGEKADSKYDSIYPKYSRL